jgi:DNA polymerase I-like protein with 3'-5' exonuclease and polymerase domains
MNDLFSAAEIAGLSGGRRPPAPKGYKLPEKFPSFDRAKRLCIDLESVDGSIANGTGPGWRRDAYICGFAVAIGDLKGYTEFSEYYPLRHKGVQNLDAGRVYDWLATETAFYTGEIVGTNLLYDFDGFQYQDIEPKLCKFRDVQWSEALLDENAFSYGLGTMAKKYGFGGKVNDELKLLYGDHYIERFHEVHPGHARAYGLGDVELPLKVLHAQSKQLRKENLEELFDLECRLLPMLLYMRRIGVRVNLEQAANMNFILAKRRDDAIARIAEMSGVSTDYENFGKPQIMKRIFDKLEIKYPFLMPKDNDGKEVLIMPPDPEDVDAGVLAKWEAARDNEESKPSFRKLWLEEALDHPIGKLILEANTAEKARGTFVDGYIGNNAIGDRVYCEFHPLRKKEDEHSKSKGTITGRFSSSNPNLQNIPTRDEFIGPMCRSMFIADEGCQWWSQDYSQVEYRLMVHYAYELKCAGAEVPRDMYLHDPKTDFHDACAKLMYKEKWNAAIERHVRGEITKEQLKDIHKKLRKPAKNLNFGMGYGMGPPLLAAQLGMTNPDGSPTDEALQIIKDYNAASPWLKALNKCCVDEAEKNEFVTTILKRRGRFILWEPRFRDKKEEYKPACPKEQALIQWPGQKLHIVGTHKALNKKIQGSAADLMKFGMVQMWEAGIFNPGNDITCSLTVHDELNGSFVPSKRGEESRLEVKRIMENCMKFNIPILTSGSVGANWAEAH